MAIRAEGMWRSSRKSKENDEWDGATGRLSERLLLAAEDAWQEAMKKQFLLEMADGNDTDLARQSVVNLSFYFLFQTLNFALEFL